MAINIKKCCPDDVHILQKISYSTFNETFKEHNTTENMHAYLNSAYTVKKLQNELANNHSEFYFLYVDDALAGYLKVNTDDAQSEEMGESAFEVERIYITNHFQKRGLGKYLLNYAEARAIEQNKTKIWLGVWENNINALQFYKKSGFIQVGSHPFYMGDDEQTDYIMMKNL